MGICFPEFLSNSFISSFTSSPAEIHNTPYSDLNYHVKKMDLYLIFVRTHFFGRTYRAAADLENHIKPALPLLPFGTKSIIGSGPGSMDQSDDTELFKVQSYKDKNSEFSRFCKAIRTIERERIKLRERLQVRNTIIIVIVH